MKRSSLWTAIGLCLLFTLQTIDSQAQAPPDPTRKATPVPADVRAGEGRGVISGRGTLTCRRPAIAAYPAQNIGVERCHGNWLPTDNTGNWAYSASAGADHFNRKSGPAGGRNCTTCPAGTTIIQDFKGLEDWCTRSIAAQPATPASTAQATCPAGKTLDYAGCLTPGHPAILAHVAGVERCHGNWTAADNTGNWNYNASAGADHFNRKNGPPGSRDCNVCPPNTYLQVDFQGVQDWCVKKMPAKPAKPDSISPPSCPPGYSWGP